MPGAIDGTARGRLMAMGRARRLAESWRDKTEGGERAQAMYEEFEEADEGGRGGRVCREGASRRVLEVVPPRAGRRVPSLGGRATERTMLYGVLSITRGCGCACVSRRRREEDRWGEAAVASARNS